MQNNYTLHDYYNPLIKYNAIFKTIFLKNSPILFYITFIID